jgi:hypothetical protein
MLIITISGREKIWILIVDLTTVILNQGMNSGKLRISFTKYGLFTKLKFTK